MSRLGEERQERLRRARLYVVSDARESGGDLEPFLDAVLGAGTAVVQLREKDASDVDILGWAQRFREAADRYGALFVLNDRVDLALSAGADGVHLGQDDLPLEAARQLGGDDLLLGVSTHSTAQFETASPEADYLCIGPVHETPTKPGRPATGLSPVREAAASSEQRPWFAIGGVDPGTVQEVVAAGARRIVVVRAVTAAADPAAAVRSLLSALPQ